MRLLQKRGQDEARALYERIRTIDPQGVVEQFRSLIAAGQYRRLYELTARYVPAGSRVLDWGCGRGHFTAHLAGRGYEVTAFSLEPEPEIFAALPAGERARITFIRGADASSLPFAGASFDAVFSVGVLEHVRETGGREEASLRELRRVVVDGGHLLIYHLPNRLSYIEAASRLLRRDSFHAYLFSPREIRELAGAAGFSVVTQGRYGLFPRNSANRLPSSLRSSPVLASAFNAADSVLERLFAPVTQNLYYVGSARS